VATALVGPGAGLESDSERESTLPVNWQGSQCQRPEACLSVLEEDGTVRVAAPRPVAGGRARAPASAGGGHLPAMCAGRPGCCCLCEARLRQARPVGGALRLPVAVAGDASSSGQAGQVRRQHENAGHVRFLSNPGNRDHSELGRSLAGCRRAHWLRCFRRRESSTKSTRLRLAPKGEDQRRRTRSLGESAFLVRVSDSDATLAKVSAVSHETDRGLIATTSAA
jgi:hypothetical protein